MSISSKITLIALVLGLTLSYSIYYRSKYKAFFKSAQGLVLKTLPSFTLKSVSGDKIFTSKDVFAKDSKTKLAMVHFWATWCLPCKEELPTLIKLATKMHQGQEKKDKIIFLLVAVRDDTKKIEQFFAGTKAIPSNIRLLHDKDGTVSSRFGTVKLPETYIFRHDKKHIDKFVGAKDWASFQMENRLNFYLENTSKAQSYD